ncbi:MAG TPA: hypothetical protein VFP87_06070 [Chitinophagaceae bacterium]|nr:hypothetical protein [Chitinophagaceae bacterium]
MKSIFITIAILLFNFSFAQKAELLKDYSLRQFLCVFWSWPGRSSDSALPGFWFMVDDLKGKAIKFRREVLYKQKQYMPVSKDATVKDKKVFELLLYAISPQLIQH